MQIKDIVAGKKINTKQGEKTQWVKVGALFVKDDGKMTVKINEWINPLAFKNDKGEVWLNVFEQKKEKTEQTEKEHDWADVEKELGF